MNHTKIKINTSFYIVLNIEPLAKIFLICGVIPGKGHL
jgi:hypothetical protein